MKLTNYIAVAILFVSATAGNLQAQSLRDAKPPAEFPPESFKAAQYVDSRGCVYIRAGINGDVTWVPRVTRKRKQVCGHPPSLPAAVIAEQSTAPAPAAEGVKEIVPQSEAVVADNTPVSTPAAGAQTTAVAVAKPKPRPVPKAVQTKPAGSAVVTTVPRNPVTNRADASNSPMVTVKAGKNRQMIPQNTRVVPRHVYENRQNTGNVYVPKGYRAAWDDDRLNPRRAEMTLRPSIARGVVTVPRGYALAWDDNRLNLKRGTRTARGDTQSDQIWSQTVPRRLINAPTRATVITVPSSRKNGNSPFWQPEIAPGAQANAAQVTRLSTRSAPVEAGEKRSNAQAKAKYVRVATYASEKDANTTARAFAHAGLPMRLGTVKRNGVPHKVVLAGPFESKVDAKAALKQVKLAGFKRARISK